MNTAKSVNEYISELKKENKKVRYTAYLMIAVLVMVLAVSVLKQFYLTLALLVAALVLQLFVFRRFQKDYVRNCENANISLTTLKKINASEIEEKGTSVDESMVKSAHIFPFVEKTFAAFKSIKGSKDNTVISSSDITVVERKNDTYVGEINFKKDQRINELIDNSPENVKTDNENLKGVFEGFEIKKI